MNDKRPDITKDQIENLYSVEHKSSIEIAGILGCGKSTILRKMKKFNIGRRSIAQALTGKTLPDDVKEKMSVKAKENQQGERHTCWKGGRLNHAQGYILIWKKDHPYAESKGYVLEHRLVMEEVVGRILGPEEVVHHVNGIRNDNRPENLMLFKDHAAHMKFHEQETGLGFQNGRSCADV